jgi:hypothetical protein
MVACKFVGALSAIQNNSGLAQGLGPANGCTVEHEGGRYLSRFQDEAGIRLPASPV